MNEKSAPPAAGQEGQMKTHNMHANYLTISINFVNIPEELKKFIQWLCWKLD